MGEEEGVETKERKRSRKGEKEAPQGRIGTTLLKVEQGDQPEYQCLKRGNCRLQRRGGAAIWGLSDRDIFRRPFLSNNGKCSRSKRQEGCKRTRPQKSYKGDPRARAGGRALSCHKLRCMCRVGGGDKEWERKSRTAWTKGSKGSKELCVLHFGLLFPLPCCPPPSFLPFGSLSWARLPGTYKSCVDFLGPSQSPHSAHARCAPDEEHAISRPRGACLLILYRTSDYCFQGQKSALASADSLTTTPSHHIGEAGLRLDQGHAAHGTPSETAGPALLSSSKLHTGT